MTESQKEDTLLGWNYNHKRTRRYFFHSPAVRRYSVSVQIDRKFLLFEKRSIMFIKIVFAWVFIQLLIDFGSENCNHLAHWRHQLRPWLMNKSFEDYLHNIQRAKDVQKLIVSKVSHLCLWKCDTEHGIPVSNPGFKLCWWHVKVCCLQGSKL